MTKYKVNNALEIKGFAGIELIYSKAEDVKLFFPMWITEKLESWESHFVKIDKANRILTVEGKTFTICDDLRIRCHTKLMFLVVKYATVIAERMKNAYGLWDYKLRLVD